MIELLLLVAIGAWVCLDRTQALQIMISRPIVIGPALGLWAGVPLEGTLVGAAFEFLYAGRLPVGSNIPPSDTLAAMGAAGILVLVPDFSGLGNAGLAVAFALPLAEWGRVIDVWVRRLNGRIADRIDETIAAGDLSFIRAANWLSLWLAGAVYAITLLIFYITSTLALIFVAPMPEWANAALALFLTALPLVGFAESVAALDVRRYSNWAIAGLAVGTLLVVVA